MLLVVVFICVQNSLNVECQKILMQGVCCEDLKQGVFLPLLMSSLKICWLVLQNISTLVRLHLSIIAHKHNFDVVVHTGWWICLDLIIKHAVFNFSAISLFSCLPPYGWTIISLCNAITPATAPSQPSHFTNQYPTCGNPSDVLLWWFTVVPWKKLYFGSLVLYVCVLVV